MSDDQPFSGPESERPFGVPAQRTPVVFDFDIGGLRIGNQVRRVADPSESTQVYSAYLALLYAVRGAKPGEQLPLRAADLEALLLLVGDDPETIEQRLIGLMGCSTDEAKVLGGILLRHRKKTVALGVAASLLLGGSLASGMGGPDRTARDAELVQTVSAEPSQASEAPAPEDTTLSGLPGSGESSVVGTPASDGATATTAASSGATATTAASSGATATTAAAPVVSGSESSGGGTFAAPAASDAGEPGAVGGPAAADLPPVAAAPEAPVEVEPGRDLPAAPGRPISGTVGGEDGDGSSFEEPVPDEAPDGPVAVPTPVMVDPGASEPQPQPQPGTS